MAYKKNCTPLPARDILHFPKAFLLKLYVTNSEDFVNYQNLRFEVGSDSKGQSHIHTAAVALYRGIKKLFDLSKSDDFIKLLPNFKTSHSENRPVQVDVFTSGELGVKASSYLKEGRNATSQGNPSSSGLCNSRKAFEQCRLSCSIATDDANHFALIYRKTNILKCPKVLLFGTLSPSKSAPKLMCILL
ncbi:hypothetical protein AXK11_04205 [Cephaloticoccus primus]|uniref:Uncharacterized protein n=1 Tax=Cephaloticoccus primus TaxID=1548207 RepID=A0A139SPN9_9BACT|nr:hypothetical protein AXK11_04205 [Cephaloticoccus primus]